MLHGLGRLFPSGIFGTQTCPFDVGRFPDLGNTSLGLAVDPSTPAEGLSRDHAGQSASVAPAVRAPDAPLKRTALRRPGIDMAAIDVTAFIDLAPFVDSMLARFPVHDALRCNDRANVRRPQKYGGDKNHERREKLEAKDTEIGTGTDGTKTVATGRGFDRPLRFIGPDADIFLAGFELLQTGVQIVDRSADAAIAAELPGRSRLGGASYCTERLGDCTRIRCISRFQGLGIDRQRSILLDADPCVAECRCIVGNDTFQLTGTNAGARAFRHAAAPAAPLPEALASAARSALNACAKVSAALLASAAEGIWRASCKVRDAVWTAAVADCACPNADSFTRVLSASCASRRPGAAARPIPQSLCAPESAVTLPAEKPVAETAMGNEVKANAVYCQYGAKGAERNRVDPGMASPTIAASMEESMIDKPVADFTLPATGGHLHPLSPARHSARSLLLSERQHPRLYDGGQQFRDLYADFLAVGCSVLGVSRDSLRSHENFKGKAVAAL